MTPKELADACDDILAAYVKGDLRARLDSKGLPPPPLSGLRRRRPALISLEAGDLSPDPVLDAGSVDLGPETPGEPSRALIDFCGLEDYVVLQEADGVTIIFLWVNDYPVQAPSPGLDISAVDFSDDVGTLGLPLTSRVVPPGNFEPARVVEECMLAVQGVLGENWDAGHNIEARLALCSFEQLAATRTSAINGDLV